MILEIFVVLLLLTLTALTVLAFKIYRTKQKMLNYQKMFQKAGYKAKLYPFEFYMITWLGRLIYYSNKYDNALLYCNQFKGYDVAIGCGLNEPSIELIHPDLLKQYFEAPVGDYIKYKPSYRNIQRLFGSGMIFSEGEQSKRKRKIISQVFHYEFVKSLAPTAIECFNNVFDEIDQQGQTTIDIGEIFKQIFCNITISSFFGYQGYKCQINGTKFYKFFFNLLEDIAMRGNQTVGLFFPQLLKMGIFAIDRSINERVILFNNFAQDYIETTIQKLKKLSPEEIKVIMKKDIFAAMYFSGYLTRSEKNQNNFNFKEFIEEFSLFVTAGTQNSSTHLTNIVVCLNKNPEVKKKLIAEINQYIKSQEDINAETIRKMKYLHGVSQQTFRMNPPINFMFLRVSTKPTILGTVPIQQGVSLFHDTCTTKGMDEKYFKNPEIFMPERWNSNLQNPYLMIPFSAGIRNCIGQHMAQIMSKVLLISFLRRYDFQIKQQIKYHMKFVISPQAFKTYIKKKQ